MRNRRIGMLVAVVVSMCLPACAHNSETDGSKEFALIHYKEDRKGKHNWSLGKGAWEHSPATSSMFGNRE